MRKTGEFRNGVYFPNPGTGRKNQDAFEAVWEFINKRKLEYPEPRFQRPVFMNTRSFEWRPLADTRGVAEKQLGIFELGFAMRYLRIDAGASVTVKGRIICYVLGGEGSADGSGYTKGDVIYADASETATIKATATTELFTMSMLMLDAGALSQGNSGRPNNGLFRRLRASRRLRGDSTPASRVSVRINSPRANLFQSC